MSSKPSIPKKVRAGLQFQDCSPSVAQGAYEGSPGMLATRPARFERWACRLGNPALTGLIPSPGEA